MSLKPFKLDETRLIVIGVSVVQLTLNSLENDLITTEVYYEDVALQEEIKKVMISFIISRRENLIADGSNYRLTCLRTRWSFGQRYIFGSKDRSLIPNDYKYMFQLKSSEKN
ncbi:4852_t:CDS:2 [Entrophospora sp. SA101]|nr:19233_t:CDS:2 [Entrophospora sp. SA101]CAJ0827621.1 19234_t:CDS:2 [Entrophospora sp. SA101]CAJ0836016.1 4852_t:CDS:2 [Entrophospora sp. SA101]